MCSISDQPVDSGLLSGFFDKLIIIASCQIGTLICLSLGEDKHDMAFAVDFNHLSHQMGDIEPKQQQKLAVEALLPGIRMLWLCYQLVLARPLL